MKQFEISLNNILFLKSFVLGLNIVVHPSKDQYLLNQIAINGVPILHFNERHSAILKNIKKKHILKFLSATGFIIDQKYARFPIFSAVGNLNHNIEPLIRVANGQGGFHDIEKVISVENFQTELNLIKNFFLKETSENVQEIFTKREKEIIKWTKKNSKIVVEFANEPNTRNKNIFLQKLVKDKVYSTNTSTTDINLKRIVKLHDRKLIGKYGNPNLLIGE